jgi:aspartyl-tRNA synthetase
MGPQLHKQMACACGGFDLDLEMAINEHYDEVLDVLGDIFVHIFDGLKDKCGRELQRIKEQYGFNDLAYPKVTLKINFATGCRLLREAGIDQGDLDDLSTKNEMKLGDIDKEKYGMDFYIRDKYPAFLKDFTSDPSTGLVNLRAQTRLDATRTLFFSKLFLLIFLTVF